MLLFDEITANIKNIHIGYSTFNKNHPLKKQKQNMNNIFKDEEI